MGSLDHYPSNLEKINRIEEINFLISLFTSAVYNPRRKSVTSKEDIEINVKLKLTSPDINYSFFTESKDFLTTREVTTSNLLLTGVFPSVSRNLMRVSILGP